METIYCEGINEIKKEKKFLEKALNIKIKINSKKITVEGEPTNEYAAEFVIDAINLGFSARIASLLADENYVFEKINIKDFTRRKNFELIRGRIIGTKGKTKKTIEELSGCKIKIKGNNVGIIGPAENITHIITGATSIIRGTKQKNVYKFLERINTKRKIKKQIN